MMMTYKNINFKTLSLEINNTTYNLKITKRKYISKLTMKYNLKTKFFDLSLPNSLSYKLAEEFFKNNLMWANSQIPSQSINLTAPNSIKIKNEDVNITYLQSKKNTYNFLQNQNILTIYYKDINDIPTILIKFLKLTAKECFTTMSEIKAKQLNVNFNKVMLSDSLYKWGSCSSKNNLRYNFRLIMAPTFVIDYIVAHEVAHLREFNHSKNFWEIVNNLTHFTDIAKAWLKQNGKSLY